MTDTSESYCGSVGKEFISQMRGPELRIGHRANTFISSSPTGKH